MHCPCGYYDLWQSHPSAEVERDIVKLISGSGAQEPYFLRQSRWTSGQRRSAMAERLRGKTGSCVWQRVPVGYADGYPQFSFPARDGFWSTAKKAPILARVCMDQFMVDVTEDPGREGGRRGDI